MSSVESAGSVAMEERRDVGEAEEVCLAGVAAIREPTQLKGEARAGTCQAG